MFLLFCISGKQCGCFSTSSQRADGSLWSKHHQLFGSKQGHNNEEEAAGSLPGLTSEAAESGSDEVTSR